jgi:hypothetical protein
MIQLLVPQTVTTDYFNTGTPFTGTALPLETTLFHLRLLTSATRGSTSQSPQYSARMPPGERPSAPSC